MSQRAGRSSPGAPTEAEAELAIARLSEMSADMRGCALIGPGGEALAASGEVERWAEPARELLAAADAAAGDAASHLHVGTEEGEVFAVREGGAAIVAVTDRFTLASLVLFDIRTVLRDLARNGA